MVRAPTFYLKSSHLYFLIAANQGDAKKMSPGLLALQNPNPMQPAVTEQAL
jgi:hypothetical protein